MAWRDYWQVSVRTKEEMKGDMKGEMKEEIKEIREDEENMRDKE